MLLFLGVLAVEQGHGCIPPARLGLRDGTKHLAMVRRTGSGAIRPLVQRTSRRGRRKLSLV